MPKSRKNHVSKETPYAHERMTNPFKHSVLSRRSLTSFCYENRLEEVVSSDCQNVISFPDMSLLRDHKYTPIIAPVSHFVKLGFPLPHDVPAGNIGRVMSFIRRQNGFLAPICVFFAFLGEDGISPQGLSMVIGTTNTPSARRYAALQSPQTTSRDEAGTPPASRMAVLTRSRFSAAASI